MTIRDKNKEEDRKQCFINSARSRTIVSPSLVSRNSRQPQPVQHQNHPLLPRTEYTCTSPYEYEYYRVICVQTSICKKARQGKDIRRRKKKKKKDGTQRTEVRTKEGIVKTEAIGILVVCSSLSRRESQNLLRVITLSRYLARPLDESSSSNSVWCTNGDCGFAV